MELRLRLLIFFLVQLVLTISSSPYYQRIYRRDDEFFKPFNLLGQAQAPMDDFFEDEEEPVLETWIEDNPSPESSFKLIETPVQLSNPVYNFFTKANAFLKWIRTK